MTNATALAEDLRRAREKLDRYQSVENERDFYLARSRFLEHELKNAEARGFVSRSRMTRELMNQESAP
jgi:hypothetical protein